MKPIHPDDYRAYTRRLGYLVAGEVRRRPGAFQTPEDAERDPILQAYIDDFRDKLTADDIRRTIYMQLTD